MPDWLTHVLVGWAVSNFLILKRKDLEPFRSTLIVGSVLPDLWYIQLFLDLIGIDLSWTLYVFHTPFGSAIMALLIGLVFLKEEVWKRGTLFLIVGAGLHLGVDLTLHHIDGGHYILFPLSKYLFELKIFWPESFTYLWIALVFWSVSYLLTIKDKIDSLI